MNDQMIFLRGGNKGRCGVGVIIRTSEYMLELTIFFGGVTWTFGGGTYPGLPSQIKP